MKKALKIIAWILGGLLALVVLLLLAIPLWLGPTVVAAANKVAPEYTGTEFSLASVGINPYSGKYSIEKLLLGNPEGYSVPKAVSVEKVFVDVDMASLFSDTIHIREITIDTLYASYVSENGTNNFEWIGAHVAEKVGPKEEEEEEEEEDKSKKKVIIDRLTITGTSVKLSVFPELPLPTITLTDIGKEKQGATWSEVWQSIIDAVTKAASSVGKGLGTALGALGDGAGTVLSGTTNVLGGATSLLGDGASKAVDSIGGLFGGDKEKGAAEKKDAAEKKADGEKKKEDASKESSGVIDAGKAAGQGVVDAGKAIGKGAVDTGKAIGNGAKDAVKKVGDLFGK